jgi:voltage-gated potassium channel Kch
MNRIGGRLLLALTLIVVLTAAGTVGYMLIERMTFECALFMTVITITTVGYGEVRPLDHTGPIFTIAFIFTGVGTAYYAFAALTEMIVGGQLREILNRGAMTRKIHQLENHVVICGYERFGRVVADELHRHGATLVVIENDPSKENALMQAGVLAAGASPGSTSRLSVRPLGLNQERTTVPQGQQTVNRIILRDACAAKVLEKATLSYCCLPRPDFQFIRSPQASILRPSTC